MTIFAFTPESLEAKILIREPLQDNDILVYVSSYGRFLNKRPQDILTSASFNVENAGSNNTVSLVANVSSGTVELRGIFGGRGIHVYAQGNDIIFEVSQEGGTVTKDSYGIVFDIDGNNSNAVFSVETGTSAVPVPLNLSAMPSLTFNGVEFHNTTSASYIYFDNLFLSAGTFPYIGKEGMFIRISGASHFDGIYSFANFVSTTSGTIAYISQTFSSSPLLGTSMNNVEINQINAIIEPDPSLPSPYPSGQIFKIHLWNANFYLPNFYNGRVFKISNSNEEKIDGFYIVNQALSSSSYFNNGITIITDVRTPFPVTTSSPLFIESNHPSLFSVELLGNVVPTGFRIEKDGTVYAERIKISSMPSDPVDVANKNYVDSQISMLVTTDISSLQYQLLQFQSKIEKRLNRARDFWMRNLFV